jgi:hypothetical protein
VEIGETEIAHHQIEINTLNNKLTYYANVKILNFDSEFHKINKLRPKS